MKRCLRHFLNIVYPRRCLLCWGETGLKAGLDACLGCLADLPRLEHACERCAESLVGSPGSAVLCGRCLGDPPPFTRTWCLGPYRDGLAGLITGLKFAGRLENGRLLGQLLGMYMAAHLASPDMRLVAVPLHRARLRARGFNQAAEIARWAAQQAGINLLKHAVTRRHDTTAQTGLGASARRANIRGAFACHLDLSGEHIGIVDDVMTTGSTAASLASTLRSAGCRRVDVWCCARASL